MCDQDSHTMDIQQGDIQRSDITHNQQIVNKQSSKKVSNKQSDDEKQQIESTRTWSLDYFKKIAKSGFAWHPWMNTRDEKSPSLTHTHYVVWNNKTWIPQRGSTRIQSFISDIAFHLKLGEFVSIGTKEYGILLLAAYKKDEEEERGTSEHNSENVSAFQAHSSGAEPSEKAKLDLSSFSRNEYILAYPSTIGLRKLDNHFGIALDYSREIRINVKLDWFTD